VDELIGQEARVRGIEPDDAAVDAELGRVRARFATTREYEDALRQAGLTEPGFRRHLERAALVREARGARAPRAPEERELRQYYLTNTGMFQRPERIHLWEILIAFDPAGADAGRGARRRVAEVLASLARGESFAALARARSESAYRVRNGDLGWVHRGRLEPALERAAFAAPLNQVRTIESDYGVHVFKVVAREPSRLLTFDEARDSIAERVGRLRLEAETAAWHARLLRSARVEYLDAALAAARPADLRIPSADHASLLRARPAPGH
jgi:peptidyl-prolyl cis-trans isomerase C